MRLTMREGEWSALGLKLRGYTITSFSGNGVVAIVFALFLTTCLLLALLGTGTFLLVDHLSLRQRRLLFLCVVLFSLLPLLLHAHHAARWIADFGPPAEPAPGLYPALRHFLLMVDASLVAALLFAAALTRIEPLLCTLMPLGFAGLYWYVLLPLAYRDPPGSGVFLNTMPLLWAFIHTLSGTLFLLLACIRLRNPSFPWKLRWISRER